MSDINYLKRAHVHEHSAYKDELKHVPKYFTELGGGGDTHFISKISYQYIVIIMIKIHLKLHSKFDILRQA